jgi:hypothetical protein
MSEVTTNAAEPIVSGTAQAKIEFVSVGRIDLSYPRTPEKAKLVPKLREDIPHCLRLCWQMRRVKSARRLR